MNYKELLHNRKKEWHFPVMFIIILPKYTLGRQGF
jgi:hypothetical protein